MKMVKKEIAIFGRCCRKTGCRSKREQFMVTRTNLLVSIAIAALLAGCSSYRGPIWVMKVESSPPGARICASTSALHDPRQPGEYLGTTPCNAAVPAKAGGKLRKQLTIWAFPATNDPALYSQSLTFHKWTTVGGSERLPPALFFDLSRPASSGAQPGSTSGR